MMKFAASLALGLGLSLLVALPADAQSRTFRVLDGSRIQFISEAPLETIRGTSSAVSGEVSLDVSNPSSAAGSRITVPVASLRTGIALRDQHLHGAEWLDAGSHPEAVFQIVSISGVNGALAPNTDVRARVVGRFTLHGQTREVTANARVRYIPSNAELRQAGINGDAIRVQASFQISLSDFGVSINPAVQLKVSDEIRVNVSIRGATERPAAG